MNVASNGTYKNTYKPKTKHVTVITVCVPLQLWSSVRADTALHSAVPPSSDKHSGVLLRWQTLCALKEMTRRKKAGAHKELCWESTWCTLTPMLFASLFLLAISKRIARNHAYGWHEEKHFQLQQVRTKQCCKSGITIRRHVRAALANFTLQSYFCCRTYSPFLAAIHS